MNDRVTILWHIERMSETAPPTLHQADQPYLLPRRGDRVTSISSWTASPGAERLRADTVDLEFLGYRDASYLNLRDLIDPVEIPEHDATTILIFKKGIEHEKRHLPSLKGTNNG